MSNKEISCKNIINRYVLPLFVVGLTEWMGINHTNVNAKVPTQITKEIQQDPTGLPPKGCLVNRAGLPSTTTEGDMNNNGVVEAVDSYLALKLSNNTGVNCTQNILTQLKGFGFTTDQAKQALANAVDAYPFPAGVFDQTDAKAILYKSTHTSMDGFVPKYCQNRRPITINVPKFIAKGFSYPVNLSLKGGDQKGRKYNLLGNNANIQEVVSNSQKNPLYQQYLVKWIQEGNQTITATVENNETGCSYKNAIDVKVKSGNTYLPVIKKSNENFQTTPWEEAWEKKQVQEAMKPLQK